MQNKNRLFVSYWASYHNVMGVDSGISHRVDFGAELLGVIGDFEKSIGTYLFRSKGLKLCCLI